MKINIQKYELTVFGFTTIELMVTCTIVSILLLISLPSLSQLLFSNRIDNQLALMKTSLSFIRIYAIDNNTNVTFCPLQGNTCTDSWHKELHLFVDFDANTSLNDNDFILKVLEPINPQDKLTYPRTAVTYRADGSIGALQSGSFVYCPGINSKMEGQRITVSQAGRIRRRDTNRCSLP